METDEVEMAVPKPETTNFGPAFSTNGQMSQKKVRNSRVYFFLVLAVLLLVTTIAGFRAFVELDHYRKNLETKLQQLASDVERLKNLSRITTTS